MLIFSLAARRAWWAENDAKFRDLVASGASATEAGAALGITKNAAIGKAGRLGLQWARSPMPEVQSMPRTREPPVAFPPPGHCLWGEGWPEETEFAWCGAPVASGAWCAKHRAIVYLPLLNRPIRKARV